MICDGLPLLVRVALSEGAFEAVDDVVERIEHLPVIISRKPLARRRREPQGLHQRGTGLRSGLNRLDSALRAHYKQGILEGLHRFSPPIPFQLKPRCGFTVRLATLISPLVAIVIHST